jgi:hypothetical protein
MNRPDTIDINDPPEQPVTHIKRPGDEMYFRMVSKNTTACDRNNIRSVQGWVMGKIDQYINCEDNGWARALTDRSKGKDCLGGDRTRKIQQPR